MAVSYKIASSLTPRNDRTILFYLPASLLVNTILVQLMSEKYVMTTPVTFLVQVYEELKKVTWPTRQEVVRLTGAVILISLVVGVFIGGLDFIFTSLLQIVVK